MGRFLTPDWSAKEEPVPYAKLDDPQSLNLYAYVRNNPLIRVDADGHIDWNYLKDKFNQIWYAKVSIGVGIGEKVKITKHLEVETEAKIGLEQKLTVNGTRTVVKAEASAGLKLGEKKVGTAATLEMQVEKDNHLSLGKPELHCCDLSKSSESKGGNAEKGTTTDGNEIGIEGHVGALGGEAGMDVDKAIEFAKAAKEQVENEVANDMKKILGN
jgi:hypothetical protein